MRGANGQAVGPTILWFFRVPSPLDWARQMNGALPLNQKAQLQNASARNGPPLIASQGFLADASGYDRY